MPQSASCRFGQGLVKGRRQLTAAGLCLLATLCCLALAQVPKLPPAHRGGVRRLHNVSAGSLHALLHTELHEKALPQAGSCERGWDFEERGMIVTGFGTRAKE